MQKGFINEKNFAKMIDKNKIKELNKNIQCLIYAIFKDIRENDIVECWKSKYFEKADIKIKINNEIKGISIKTGKYCSVHQESTKTLYPFFRRVGIEEKTIKALDSFLIGKVNDKRVDAITYIFHNYEEIKKIKDSLNNYYIKVNLILRFLFLGTEKQNYGCDAIIYGVPNSFLWATKEEILEYLINYDNNHEIFIKFSALNLKSYDRNLRNNEEKKSKQNEIQIKWNTIKIDLQNIEKLRKHKKKVEIGDIFLNK